MRLMYKKFTAALLAFLMIFSMGGMLRPLAENNTSQAQTSQEPKVNGSKEVYINEKNFPDPNFRQYLLDNTTYTTEGNDKYYNEDQLAAIKDIDLYKANCEYIQSLEGIGHFKNLTSLNCNNNQIKSLDLSKNTALTKLDCYNNSLTSLDLSSNTALEKLNCVSNQLINLDLSEDTALKDLNCSSNQITNLDLSSNTALTSLCCTYGKLKSLDLSKNTALKDLNCSGNQLTSLDLSNHNALTELYCFNNRLTSLDLSNDNNLTRLYCYYNQITSLDLSSNSALKDLNCYGNQLTNLDISKNTALTNLVCNSNQLTSLDVSKNTALESINCSDNELTNLEVSKNTVLETLYCSNNQLISLDTSGLNLTDFSGENQTSNVDPNDWYYDELNKAYVVDMAELLGGNGDIIKVNITSSDWFYFFNIHRAYYYSQKGHAPSNLSYNYATDDNGHQLQVNLHLNIK